MARLRAVDQITLAILVPLWLLCFALCLRSAALRISYSSLYVSAAPEPDGYPVLVGFWPHLHARQSGLEIGDRLVRLGSLDLRGVGPVGFAVRVTEEAGSAERLPLVFEREGRRNEASVALGSYDVMWPLLVVSLAFAVTAILLLVRSPEAGAVRAAFHAYMCLAIAAVSLFGGSRSINYTSFFVTLISASLVGPLLVRSMLVFPHGIAPRTRAARFGPWAFLVIGPLSAGRLYNFPLPHFVGQPGFFAAVIALCTTLLLVMTRTYRRTDPIGRRQIKWLTLGIYCAVTPMIAAATLAVLEPRFVRFYVLAGSAVALFPLSVLIAIVRYNLFDIDRLISATTSYTIALVLAVAGGLLLIPQLAEMTSRAVGLDASVGQVLLAFLLAGLVVPARRTVGDHVDRWFFPDRYAFVHGTERLLEELSQTERFEDLALRAGEQLDQLLRPESCVIYVRNGPTYAPLFVRGRAAPGELQAGGSLVGILEQQIGAVDVASCFATGAITADQEEVLHGLHAAVLLPIRRRQALVALVSLGRKQSGDSYTATDRALLAAVADKISTELLRFDDATLASIGEAMSRLLHDLKNPLTVVSGYTDIMSTLDCPEQREEYAALIQKQCKLMDSMTRDVLAYARGESRLFLRNVRVPDFLGELARQLEPELRRCGVQLVIESQYHGSGCFDEAKILRAAYNLARNATEAMPDGGTFRITARSTDGQLVLEFADSGNGIAAEVRDRLFQSFVSGKKEGTGLGLATVKSVVDEHRGTIRVSSIPGRGATFTIALPLDPQPASRASA